jgi:hypothetical protein
VLGDEDLPLPHHVAEATEAANRYAVNTQVTVDWLV